MTNEELFLAMRPIIMEACGVPALIYSNDSGGGKAPSGEYGTLYPRVDERSRGQAVVIQRDAPDNKVETILRRPVIVNLSVNFYRGNAHQYAAMLIECNKHPTISMMLQRVKLGWVEAGPVNDLTSLQSANWEQRAQINIRIMYTSESRSLVNNILTVDYTLEDEKGRELSKFEIPKQDGTP